ncbi:MAG: molybdopterin-guanine dinucleotide biosynthesis protein B [Deltaproteobacteria bacterium]|nr:molybdopterin-guanine dinucleotide biosynthesis protein B [Deltaproteobacteria bacterium]
MPPSDNTGRSDQTISAVVPPVLAVCGVKNSGKTTLIEALLPLLIGEKLKVAVVKHDGHDFRPDVPGADSRRFLEAGAYGAAVYSPRRYMVTARWDAGAVYPDISQILAHFREADLVVLEGGKNSPLPKLEVVRAGVSAAPVSLPPARVAVVTDLPARDAWAPVLDLDDPPSVLRFILRWRLDSQPRAPGKERG